MESRVESRGLSLEEMNRRKEQMVVITGAGSGIGRECLRWFAREGYCCVGIDLDFENEESFKKSLSLGDKDNVCLERCDVTRFDDFRTIIEKSEKKFGYIHCLINNAGVKYSQSIDKQDPKEWADMLNVNVLGVLNGIRCVVDKMKQHKDGCIINIGDTGAHKGFGNHVVYCASKCAVHGITEGIRCELLKDNVKVIAINPGAVDTPSFVSSQDKGVEDQSHKWKQSLRHGLLVPEDVARCCLFAYQQPKRCLIREIQVAPLEQTK